jgi:hypothetical protein
VRSIVNEVLVGQTQYSYTYAQPPRKDTLYNLAHGTLAAEALRSATTRLTYTMLRDDSMLTDEAARRRDEEARRARISAWLKNMKVLAEGGTLPPKPTGTLRPPITTPLLNPDPHYASLPLSVVVDAPVQKVWGVSGSTATLENGASGVAISSPAKRARSAPSALRVIRSLWDRRSIATPTPSRCVQPAYIRCITERWRRVRSGPGARRFTTRWYGIALYSQMMLRGRSR